MPKHRPTTWTLTTGAILAASALLAGCTATDPAGESPKITVSQGAVTPDAPATETPTTETSTTETPAPDPDAKVTFEEAAKIATDKYGGTVISVESDTHGGEPTWEVELKDTSEGRIEVDVSKATGEIVSFEHDDD